MRCEVRDCVNSKESPTQGSYRVFRVPNSKIAYLKLDCDQKDSKFAVICNKHFETLGKDKVIVAKLLVPKVEKKPKKVP